MLDAKYRKMKQGKTGITIVHRIDMHDRVSFCNEGHTPDFLLLTCPSHFGKIKPQLKSLGLAPVWLHPQ